MGEEHGTFEELSFKTNLSDIMTLAALEQVTGAIKVTLVAVREEHITGRCGVGKCRQLC